LSIRCVVDTIKGVAMNKETEGTFREARREIAGVTAGLERRVLAAIARRMPPWVSSDHLTLVGALGAVGCGVAYGWWWRAPWVLHLANLGLLANWFGDSLDGTLARYRRRCRPRYGFYVDHIIDAFGILAIVGGLVAGGLMSLPVGAALILAYDLMAINVYLATHTLGVFRISYGPLGGTELRILLAGLNLACLFLPTFAVAGLTVRLFDLAGAIVAIGLLVLTAASSARTGRQLYGMETLPHAASAPS
jgi:archaetidylinositol phosphate synthase